MKNGISTSVKVDAIMPNGIMLNIGKSNYFLPYNAYPWFEKAKVADVFDVKMCGKYGISWENLDVDLAIESFENPTKYPFIAK